MNVTTPALQEARRLGLGDLADRYEAGLERALPAIRDAMRQARIAGTPMRGLECLLDDGELPDQEEFSREEIRLATLPAKLAGLSTADCVDLAFPPRPIPEPEPFDAARAWGAPPTGGFTRPTPTARNLTLLDFRKDA